METEFPKKRNFNDFLKTKSFPVMTNFSTRIKNMDFEENQFFVIQEANFKI